MWSRSANRSAAVGRRERQEREGREPVDKGASRFVLKSECQEGEHPVTVPNEVMEEETNADPNEERNMLTCCRVTPLNSALIECMLLHVAAQERRSPRTWPENLRSSTNGQMERGPAPCLGRPIRPTPKAPAPAKP